MNVRVNHPPTKEMQALDAAQSRHDVEWVWVKGHADIPGNEEADALANRGIDEL